MPMSRRFQPPTPRQREVAILSALLLSPADIAERTGYALVSVRAILKRPDVQAIIASLQAERASRMSETLFQRLMDDGPRNLDRIFALRDQDENLSVAKGAAELLLERQLPRITRHQEDRHIHVHLSREELAEGRRVLKEAASIPIEDYTVE